MNLVSSVDIVIFRLHHAELQTLIYKRESNEQVFSNCWSLIGGTLNINDIDLDNAVHRTLQRRIGQDVAYVEQVCTEASPTRDPRGWSQTTVYFALLRPEQHIAESDHLKWVSVDHPQLKSLAFDHAMLFNRVLQRVRNKASYSLLPAFLLSEKFTIAQLKHAYEMVMAKKVSENKLRDELKSNKSLSKVEKQKGVAHRPSDFYSVNSNDEFIFAVPLVK
jgi:8-oxo-dGTP diphosphatase